MKAPQYSLTLGDCLKAMAKMEAGSVDAIIADLPYGTTACAWDSVIPLAPMWEQFKRVIKPNGAIVLFGSQPFTSELIMSNREWFKYCWVWEKSKASDFINANFRPMKSHEDIAVFSNADAAPGCSLPMQYNPQGLIKKIAHRFRSGSLGINRDRKSQLGDYESKGSNYPLSVLRFASELNPVHPTAKPVDLLAYLIRTYTNPGETVLDCTMGSGTTGVAAIQEGRRFVGMELDPTYYDIAMRRIGDAARAADGLPKLLSGRTDDYDKMPLFAEVAT